MAPHILAIAGGVGGAKLALGLTRVLPPDALTLVVNTGDDETFHGLHISPDLDSVTYALAGMTNSETGWGIASDSFRTLGALDRLGAETWFMLGDLDLATHIRRTDLLRQGYTLSEATREITQRLGIVHPILPMSDAPVHTVVITDEGELPFQVYFVKRQCEPRMSGVRFAGIEQAMPSPGFLTALATAEVILFCPSNPFVSIGPVLGLPGIRDAIAGFEGPRIAVSPIVGGQAIKGPAAKMLSELGEPVSSAGIAQRYAGLCDTVIIDAGDAAEAAAIRVLGMQPVVTNTIMRTEEDKVGLAREIVRLAEDRLGL